MPKTIFGTTEKSNFILNMGKVTAGKWVTGLLCAGMILPLIGGMVITLVPKTNALLGAFLYASGFSCLLFYIVLLLRKDIKVKENLGSFFVFGLAAMAFASYYRAALQDAERIPDAVNTAILGETGRYEGLLALLAYFGIFLLAAGVMKRGSVKLIFDVLIGAGIVQGVFAVMQHIPWGFPSDFRKLPALLLLKDVHLSSGLSDSPIFYGSFVTIVISVGAVGAVYEKNTVRARVYGFAALFSFLTGLFTSSVIPLIGAGAAIIVLTICEFTAGKGGAEVGGILRSSRKRLAALILSIAAVLGIVLCTQGIYLRDKAIAYSDCFYRLYITFDPSPVNHDSLWKIGTERSLIMIKDHPILGVGPDLMAKYQLYNDDLRTDGIDRSYNEYLYTAATRGLPSLALYLALLGLTAVRLIKSLKEFKNDRENWFRPALLTAAAAYSIQAFFSVSAVTVAPFFWLLLGMAWSDFKQDE